MQTESVGCLMNGRVSHYQSC